jgi:hypothetical protein
MKYRPVGSELFHADGQKQKRTDRHNEANSRFWQYCERAQKRNNISAFWKLRVSKASCYYVYLSNNMYLTRHTIAEDTLNTDNGGRRFLCTRVHLYQTIWCHASDGNFHIYPVEIQISKNVCPLNQEMCTDRTKTARYRYMCNKYLYGWQIHCGDTGDGRHVSRRNRPLITRSGVDVLLQFTGHTIVSIKFDGDWWFSKFNEMSYRTDVIFLQSLNKQAYMHCFSHASFVTKRHPFLLPHWKWY